MITSANWPLANYAYVRELVAAAQDRHHVSLTKLGRMMGVSRNTLHNWRGLEPRPTPIPFASQILLEYYAGKLAINVVDNPGFPL